MKMEKNTRLILALDVEDESRALTVCREVVEYVDAIKVGYPLVLSNGLGILRKLTKFGKPLIADFKVADIPWISEKICEIAATKGADYVIVQGFLGEDVIKACSEVAEIFVVTEMTHPGAKEFMQKEGLRIAALAKRHAYGIVAPATRPERIRKLRKVVGGLIIISPGIKAQGAEIGSALKAGADYEIIGRGMCNAVNPREAAQDFYDAIKKISNVKK
jgi:orotidine-5'-phosphate decarboxylase